MEILTEKNSTDTLLTEKSNLNDFLLQKDNVTVVNWLGNFAPVKLRQNIKVQYNSFFAKN